MTVCQTCVRIAARDARDAGDAPIWDAILRSEHWDLVHAYDSALPGWLVLVTRRHIAAIDELTPDEAAELGPLLRRASLALRATTGCIKTYVAQFAESPDHPHVHFHIVPRMADCPDDRRGPKVFGYLGAAPEERVREERMIALALALREHLATFEREGDS